MNRLVLALCVMALAATSIDASPVCFPIAPAFPADQKGEDLARQLRDGSAEAKALALATIGSLGAKAPSDG